MCRFSVQNAVSAEPASPGLEQLLENDAFDWFECLDDLPEEQLPALVAPAVAPRDSDSSAGSEAMPDMGAASSSIPCVSGASDGSSFNLMEMFKQQIEQGPAAMHIAAQGYGCFPGYAPAPVAAPEQCLAPAAVPSPDLKLQAYSSGMSASTATAAGAAAAAAYALPPVALAPSYSMSSGMADAAAAAVTATACTQQQQQQAAAAPIAPRKPGGRQQRSPAEIEAAVERIKEKRRQSAQRSRARKNDYMRQLEFENQSLKDEVARLQQLLAQVQHGAATCMQMPCGLQQQQQQVAPAMM